MSDEQRAIVSFYFAFSMPQFHWALTYWVMWHVEPRGRLPRR